MIRINLITRADKARLASRRWRERNPELALSRPRNSVLSHLCPHGRTRKDRCRDCSGPEPNRNRHLKAKYGITVQEWETMFDSQGRCCDCCQSKDPGNAKGWFTDHNHLTEKLRAIICYGCNTALGCVDDSLLRLEMLISYLRKYNVS
jgi:hypothetical protein